MLSDIVTKGLLHCAGVFGFWRANSVADDIEIYDDNGSVVATLYGLRQQVLCLLFLLSLRSVWFIHSCISYILSYHIICSAVTHLDLICCPILLYHLNC